MEYLIVCSTRNQENIGKVTCCGLLVIRLVSMEKYSDLQPILRIFSQTHIFSMQKRPYCLHSSGAGTAAPVAVMLRSQYPDIRCLCIAPPGGLFSEGLATRCQSFVTTYVHNTDLVPRISTQTVERLRDKVLQMVARIKVPKRQMIKIYKSGKKLSELPCGLKELLHDADAIPESHFKAQLDRFKQSQKERQNSSKIPLHPPGKFIHFVKTMSSQEQRIILQGRFMMGDIFNCFTCDRFVAEDKYAPRYAALSDFDDIIISSTLISDHMVETVELAFMFAADAFGVDPSEPPPPMPVDITAMNAD